MIKMYNPLRQFAFLLGAAFLLIGCSQAAGPTLTAPEALAKAQAAELTLIDIRTPMEWRQTGVAPLALRIDMQNPKGPEGFADKVLTAVQGDKSAPIAIICRTGNRSGYMQQELMARGFSNVYNVSEGMVGSKAGPGWIRRGLPIESCTNC
jgi:rhodanese-related sulfurtransferase|nr:rhodanese-like domain-containing protein [uncultured Thiocystis sp.]